MLFRRKSTFMSYLKTAGLCVVTGAALGTAAGLLFAPQPGTATRKQLRQYSRRAQAQATRFGRDMRTGVDRVVEYGRKLVA